MARHYDRTEGAAIGRRTRSRRRRDVWLRLIVVAGVAAGLLVLAAVAAAAGVVVGAVSGMPALSQLLAQTPAQTTVLYDSHGNVIAQLHGGIDRIAVASDKIPSALKQATSPGSPAVRWVLR